MSYPDSVRYLYALGNELQVGAKWGLDRMNSLLEALGNPARGKRFIHVAGTNGKGSTCAMIASVLRQAGLRTGLNTSPHLIEPTERIQIDGQPVGRDEFARAFEAVYAAAEKLVEEGRLDAHPSYFETVTAMALLVFAQTCDVAVVEVGLGGRLDATNVIAPDVTVITPVSFDHESFLGNTIQLIASEKAGIVKRGVPLVLSRQSAAAQAVIEERARELGCKVVRTGDAVVADVMAKADGSAFSVDGDRYECALPGRHQIENAITAILACRELGIAPDVVRAGLGRARWPGRLEIVSRHPDFVLDGAHNPAGAQALASYIREFCADRPVWIVYGAMRDKAIDEVAGQLFPLAERLILTAPNFPRALRPETILATYDHPNPVLTSTVREAIAAAGGAPANAAVFFTGSLYLVGEARGLLLAQS